MWAPWRVGTSDICTPGDRLRTSGGAQSRVHARETAPTDDLLCCALCQCIVLEADTLIQAGSVELSGAYTASCACTRFTSRGQLQSRLSQNRKKSPRYQLVSRSPLRVLCMGMAHSKGDHPWAPFRTRVHASVRRQACAAGRAGCAMTLTDPPRRPRMVSFAVRHAHA